jgi:hypothetical protein
MKAIAPEPIAISGAISCVSYPVETAIEINAGMPPPSISIVRAGLFGILNSDTARAIIAKSIPAGLVKIG